MRVESRVMRCEANLGRLTGNVADSQSVANIAKLKATQVRHAAAAGCIYVCVSLVLERGGRKKSSDMTAESWTLGSGCSRDGLYDCKCSPVKYWTSDGKCGRGICCSK